MSKLPFLLGICMYATLSMLHHPNETDNSMQLQACASCAISTTQGMPPSLRLAIQQPQQPICTFDMAAFPHITVYVDGCKISPTCHR